jgi:ribosomal protein RSM22 (predicted rRNA methylase)
MAGALPADLASAIAAMLEGVSRTELAERAQRISREYRDRHGSASAIAGREDAVAYLVTRMPATYAAIAAAFAALRDAAPEFAPKSVLDAGAGPGTASFAAAETWPEIDAITMVDANRAFLAVAAEIAAQSARRPIASAARVHADATAAARKAQKADLVVAGYALAEIAEAQREDFVLSLWNAATGALALVEPGTPDGFERIRAARRLLIDAGARIAAPCPHAMACPIVAPDWCHFAERVQRSRDHRIAKGGDAPYEDEKYAYVVAVRPDVTVTPHHGRVLAPPRVAKAGIGLKICAADGAITPLSVAKRDRVRYAAARRVWWGEVWDEPARD